MRHALALLLVALGLVLTPPADAGEPLRFVTTSLPPLQMLTNDEPDGAVLEVLREACQRLDHPFVVQFLPFQRALDAPRKTPGTAFAGASRTPARESQFKWVGPLLYDEIVLVTRADIHPTPASLGQARSWRVGALMGGHTEAVLHQGGFTNIERLVDYETGARMLHLGRIDAWAASRLSAPYLYRALGFDPASLRFGAPIARNDVYLALSPNVADSTVATWQKTIDRLKAEGRIAAITRRFGP